MKNSITKRNINEKYHKLNSNIHVACIHRMPKLYLSPSIFRQKHLLNNALYFRDLKQKHKITNYLFIFLKWFQMLRLTCTKFEVACLEWYIYSGAHKKKCTQSSFPFIHGFRAFSFFRWCKNKVAKWKEDKKKTKKMHAMQNHKNLNIK